MHADNEPDLDRDAPIVSATTSVMAVIGLPYGGRSNNENLW